MGSRHMCEMWRLFFCSLENLITKTHKSNNEYTKLNQIRICNHRIALLSSVWRVSSSLLKEGLPPGFGFPYVQCITLSHHVQRKFFDSYSNIKINCFLPLPQVNTCDLSCLFFSPVLYSLPLQNPQKQGLTRVSPISGVK